jgi:LysR family transcriptional regulator, benzoate and cis,cis-muconate-responsive activator of ben and cat genes
MELRHLRYFLAVIEHGTVTAAASQLHIAQPAISRQLQALERELGVALFTRRGPRLVLTHAGIEMLCIRTSLTFVHQ